MSDHAKPCISTRKEPQQARSNDLVAAILEGAVQVLVEEGAPRFTTARVAEKAGVSVGSLYQYFPNKAAILFRLQADEWRQSSEMLRAILEDDAPPEQRLRRMVHAFVRSECEEAAVRRALSDAAPLYRDAPEAKAARAEAEGLFDRFMEALLPDATDAGRALASDLISDTMSTVGKRFSEQPRTGAEIDAYAGAMADMFCAYVAARREGVTPDPAT